MPALAAVRCVGSSSCRCAHLVLQSDGEPWALFAKTVDPVRAKVPNQLEGRLLVEIISWELVENLGHFVSRDKKTVQKAMFFTLACTPGPSLQAKVLDTRHWLLGKTSRKLLNAPCQWGDQLTSRSEKSHDFFLRGIYSVFRPL